MKDHVEEKEPIMLIPDHREDQTYGELIRISRCTDAMVRMVVKVGPRVKK